ncbi:MAG: branched-chain amino acid ABC transporter permease [Planctomycetota bacterium]|nr:branched-chain amino acid ABC transporter permease [Planctomycetota bacterium]
MTEFITQVLNGLTFGALIALVAVGYTMVYGIIKLINFAHGEFYMTGGVAGMLILSTLAAPGMPLNGAPGLLKLLLALAAAGACVAVLAAVTERLAYRPIRDTGRIAALLTAVGVSLFLQNTGIAIFGARQTAFPETLADERFPRFAANLDDLEAGQPAARQIAYRAPFRQPDGAPMLDPKTGQPLYMQVNLVEAGKVIEAAKLERARRAQPEQVYAYAAVTVSVKQFIVFLALALSAAGLYVLVQRTKIGRAMRAVSHDMEAAGLMGISVDFVILLTFLVGGFLAGVGGVLAGGMFIGTVDPMMGFMLGLKAFIAAVLGASGAFPGRCWAGCCWGWWSSSRNITPTRCSFRAPARTATRSPS